MTARDRSLWAAGLACAFIAMSAAGPIGGAVQAGTAQGTLSIGSTAITVTHVLAAATKDGAGAATYRVLLTNKAVPSAASLAWDTVAFHMAEHEIHGIEIVVGADKQLVRTNVYSPQAAMGARLLQAPTFEPTVLDGRSIAARLRTTSPLQDPRLGVAIAFDVSFTAPIRPGGG